MKQQKIKKYARLVILQSKIAFSVRYILMTSLSASFTVMAQSTGTLPVSTKQSVRPESVKFNSDFIHGQSVDVSRYFEGNPAPAGEYAVQVSINGKNRGQHKVLFTLSEGQSSARPCFEQDELSRLGVRLPGDTLQTTVGTNSGKEKAQCAPIDQWLPGTNADYITGDFQLNLTIPQAYLVHYPRGYIDPNTWDSGVTAAILDYNTNVYIQRQSGYASSGQNNSVNGNLGLLAGLNFYGWRFRKRLNTNWDSSNATHTRPLFTYLQRDVPVLRSQVTLGDSTTNSYLFDSLTVRGVQLQSDDRMLPDGLRYYTPLVRGYAETNARVQVTQRGQMLYETTVPPGPFELSDIGAMGYGGDLQVTITEADGRQRRRIVPFSAPPMLLHEGGSRFGVTFGKLKDNSLLKEPGLAQFFYQYGLTNMYTLYGGGQFADNYRAFGIGNAFNTSLGGVSIDMIHARSDSGHGRISSGSSYNIGFSKYIETTSTDVNLAVNRYSSKGFYSLRDAALERYSAKNHDSAVDYRTRQRFTISVGQPLWNGATVSLSGNFYNYWNSRSSTSQYMFSYGKSERYFSWNISASRSCNGEGRDVNSVMLSISVPLGNSGITRKPAFNSLYSTISYNNDGSNALQMTATGSQGEQNELSYGIGTAVNHVRNEGIRSTFNANMNYNSRFGQFGSTASASNKQSQFSLSANGSLVAHRGGITAGPRLGDYPFALVEARGAEGAQMLNGYGSRIDANGYAIVPSLTPYRENTVAVNVRGLPDTVDILESESVVVPRMGAAVKVSVKTLVGNPVVLIVKDASKGEPLPVGAEINDEHDISLGIIGQGGMAFIRGWQADKYNLYVKTPSGKRLCTIHADSNIAHKITNVQGSVIQVGVICH